MFLRVMLAFLVLTAIAWADPLSQARRYRDSDNPDRCLAALQSAKPTFETKLLRAWAYFTSQRRRRAAALLEELEQQDRSGLPAAVAAQFYVLRGDICHARSQMREARLNYEEALRVAPGDFEARLGLVRLGDSAEALLADFSQGRVPARFLWKLLCQQAAVTSEPARKWLYLDHARRAANSLSQQAKVESLLANFDENRSDSQGSSRHDQAALRLYRQDGNHSGAFSVLRDRIGRGLAYDADQGRREAFLDTLVADLHRERPHLDAELRLSSFHVEMLARTYEHHYAESRAVGARMAAEARLARDPQAEALAYARLALNAELDDQFDQAAREAQSWVNVSRGLSIAADDILWSGAAHGNALTSLGEYQLGRGRYREALAAFREGLPLADSLSPYLRRRLMRQTLRLELEAGNSAAARQIARGWRKMAEGTTNPVERAAEYELLLYAFGDSFSKHWQDPTDYRITPLVPGSLRARLLAEMADDILAALVEARKKGPKARWYLLQSSVHRLLQEWPAAEQTTELLLHAAREEHRGSMESRAYFLRAQLLERSGRLEEALQAAGEAVELAIAARHRAWEDVCRCFTAYLQLRLNRPEQALQSLQPALARPEEKQFREVAVVYALRAQTLQRLGRSAEAEAMLEKALHGLTSRGLELEVPGYLWMAAQLRAQAGRREEAVRTYKSLLDRALRQGALSIVPSVTLELHRLQPDGATVLEALNRVLDPNFLGLDHPQPGSPLERDLHALVDVALQALVGEGRHSEATALLARYRNWESSQAPPALQQALGQYRLTSSGKSSPEDLQRARQEVLAGLNRLRQRNPELAAVLPASSDELVRFQAAIPEDTVVLQYYPGSEALYVQVVTRNGARLLQHPVPEKSLRQAVRDWREAIRARQPSPAGQRLSAWLLDPLGDTLKGARHVWVLPTGTLWYLPFASLPGYPQLDWCALGPADLPLLNQPAQRPQGVTLLVGPPPGANLPEAEKEIEGLAKVLTRVQVLSGHQSSRSRLAELAPGAAHVHLATHANVDSSDLNHSSLALADGPLTLEEVYGLRLPAGSLVSLGACNSALGESNPGREATALSSAFRVAGATSVVASLWPVDDASTREFFVEFYTRLGSGAGRAQALRAAQESVRKSHPEPYYWAGFVLLGDPR